MLLAKQTIYAAASRKASGVDKKNLHQGWCDTLLSFISL